LHLLSSLVYLPLNASSQTFKQSIPPHMMMMMMLGRCHASAYWLAFLSLCARPHDIFASVIPRRSRSTASNIFNGTQIEQGAASRSSLSLLPVWATVEEQEQMHQALQKAKGSTARLRRSPLNKQEVFPQQQQQQQQMPTIRITAEYEPVSTGT
jgi:hypothetical protein